MGRQAGGGLARLWDGGSVAGMTDGQLLDRFAGQRRGAAAEAAFEALVQRHGPMVARVCRSCLRDEHDVEDAFQATFLVLVRRAESLGERDRLAPWLYGVAHKVARKARAVAARRRGREGERAGTDPPARLDSAGQVGVELAPVLHEEVDRLPAKYRDPVILCHLQGLTHAEAAQELAWPVGTVSVRLARARRLLADRLARRGVTTASVTVVTATLAAEASAAALIPLAWTNAVTLAALSAATGLTLTTATAGAVSAGAITLARRTSMTLILSAWKWLIIPPAVALATAGGAALVGSAGQGEDPPTPSRPTVTKISPPPTGPASEAGGDPTGQRPKATDQRLYKAQDMIIRGPVGTLAETVENLKTSNPQATFRLEVSGGVEYRTLAPAPTQIEIPATDPFAQPKLTIALVGPMAVAPGERISYQIRVANPRSASGAAQAVAIRVVLPQEGGKLTSGPLPAGAAFLSKERHLVWKIAELKPGQSVDRQFSYETSTPGDYHCTAEVTEGSLRATDELVTHVGDRPSTNDDPQPTPISPETVKLDGATPPVGITPAGDLDLSKLPAGYFNLPAADPAKPGSPQPVRVGQTLRVEVLEALPGRPLSGERVVRADGTISLGFYRDLYVAGLNRDQIKVKLLEQMRKYVSDQVLGLVARRGEDGEKLELVPPLDSNRVFVDDQPGPPGRDKQPVQDQAESRPADPLGQPTAPIRRPDPTPLPVDNAVRVPGGAGKDRPPVPIGPDGEPQRTPADIQDEEKPLVAVAPVVIAPDGEARLGALPPDYFTLPAADPSQPGSPQPVRVGQTVRVEVLEALPSRPITGERVVRPDGTISLGFYGDLAVAGLNRDQIKVKLLDHLREYVSEKVLGLIVARGPDGNRIEAVPPVDSNRIFVDDYPERPTAPLGRTLPKRPVAPDARPASGPTPVKIGQTLVVEVLEALPGRPITGERIVRPDGTMSLGFYGDLAVVGLTRDQIKVKVIEHLRRFLDEETLGLRVTNPRTDQVETVPPVRSDRVFVDDTEDYDPAAAVLPAADGKILVGQILVVEALEALPGRPITGERMVRPDGTISLGFYGDLPVVGLTRDQIKAKVIDLLRAKLTDEQLGLVRVAADGSRQAIDPARSDRVFVDEFAARRKPTSGSQARDDQLQAQIADLSGKLDAALGAIEQLRRDKDQAQGKLAPAPEPAPPTGPKPMPTLPPGAALDPPGGRGPGGAVRLAALADPGAELDEVLAAWERQRAPDRSYLVSFERIDHSAKWGSKTLQGTLLLQSPGQACLEFKRTTAGPDGKPRRKLNSEGQSVLEVAPDPMQRIVWTGKEIVHYEWDDKAVYTYPLRDGVRIIPFDWVPLLDVVRLPFLFELTAAELRQRYDLKLIARDDRTIRVRLTPQKRANPELFRFTELWLDRTTLLPSRMALFSPGKDDLQEIRFTQIVPNKPTDNAYFEARTHLPGWTTNQGGEGFTPPPSLVWFLNFLGGVMTGKLSVP